MKTGWDKPLTDWSVEVEELSNKEIRSMAQTAFERIKQRTPVDSGNLRAAWVYDEMKSAGIIDVVISNDEEYVFFVEYGTDRMVGKYMLERTLHELVEGTIK